MRAILGIFLDNLIIINRNHNSKKLHVFYLIYCRCCCCLNQFLKKVYSIKYYQKTQQTQDILVSFLLCYCYCKKKEMRSWKRPRNMIFWVGFFFFSLLWNLDSEKCFWRNSVMKDKILRLFSCDIFEIKIKTKWFSSEFHSGMVLLYKICSNSS